MKTLINGKAYGWSQIELVILGVQVAGVTSINYDDTLEYEDGYGAGAFPVVRGSGNYAATGSITLSMEELEKLQEVAPQGRIQYIPEFDIIVSFVDAETNRTKTHRLKSCRFKNNGREMSQNDKFFNKDIELIVAEIDWLA